jgi:hypothetical protein
MAVPGVGAVGKYIAFAVEAGFVESLATGVMVVRPPPVFREDLRMIDMADVVPPPPPLVAVTLIPFILTILLSLP